MHQVDPSTSASQADFAGGGFAVSHLKSSLMARRCLFTLVVARLRLNEPLDLPIAGEKLLRLVACRALLGADFTCVLQLLELE